MSDDQKPHGTGIKHYPPVILAVAVALALGVHWLIPVRVVPDTLQMPLGVGFIGFGGVLGSAAAYSFWRHKTTIHPHGAASTLMTRGVFRFSRNPIYLAMVLVSAGIGVWVDTLWMVPALVGAIRFLQQNVIALEERFLEAHFGDDYLSYKKRVRRWV